MTFALQEVPDLTGESDAVKVARPVRKGEVAKVPFDGNSVASYLTRESCRP